MGFIKSLVLKVVLRVARSLGHEDQNVSSSETTTPIRKLLIDSKVFRFNTQPQIDLKQFFLSRGYLVTKTVNLDELQKLLLRLSPVNIQEGLIRVGGSGDGGYLVPNNIIDIAACFSPGVAENASFEEELNGISGAKAYLADYSVEEPPLAGSDFHFVKKFLGLKNNDMFMRLEDWVTNCVGDEGEEDFLLQMDIEGHEYSVLLDTPQSVLSRFRIMVIEFHSLDQLFGFDSFPWIKAVFDHLLENFSIVHIHPNNCGPVWEVGDIKVPSVLEMTFYRKDQVVQTAEPLVYPHILDEVNVPHREDIRLGECWGVASRLDNL